MSTLKGIIFYDSQQKFPFKQKEKQGHIATILEFHWLKLKTTSLSGDFEILFDELSATTVAFIFIMR